MTSPDWSQINEYVFVSLVADLLGPLGFVDIVRQGTGPDGGVDLLATELVPYTIKGRTAFRWAIQCKFSKGGAAASVTDNEVRDVEGILRSDRLAAQEVHGYMLVTNRRISQNVIERLKGIDRRTQFRTAQIDNNDLIKLLAAHPRVLEAAFGSVGISGLGFGAARAALVPIAVREAGATPLYMISVSDSFEKESRSAQAQCVFNPTSEICAIPKKLAAELNLRPSGAMMVDPLVDDPKRVEVYWIVVKIEGLPEVTLEAVAIDLDHVMLGRSFVGLYTVVTRPNGSISFFSENDSQAI